MFSGVSPCIPLYILSHPCSTLSDSDLVQLKIEQEEKQNLVEEILTEISVYFGILYHLIEIFKGHDDFADELSMYSVRLGVYVLMSFVVSLDPPLPVYLFNVVSSLRDKNTKGYPMKKVSVCSTLMMIALTRC